LVGSGWVTRSDWFGSLNATSGKPVNVVHGLATCGMSVSFGRFGYRCDSYELVALGYNWVT
jgi:hypothetical protein